MAPSRAHAPSQRMADWLRWLLLAPNGDTRAHTALTTLLLLGELILSIFIVRYVKYTEIDWSTYMQQVALYQSGEKDYALLKGDTGPLVYPAGFLHVYGILRHLTDGGSNILHAQYIFIAFYMLSQLIVMQIYTRSKAGPPWILILLTLSKRLHSIFVLRLFNDGLAMVLLYASILAMIYDRWHLSAIAFTWGLSIKMNILLFMPAWGLLAWLSRGPLPAIGYVVVMLLHQAAIGLPFLLAAPRPYLARAFDISRVFLYEWTVNWRFTSEEQFLSRSFSTLLLVVHAAMLLAFAFKWTRPYGGLQRVISQGLQKPTNAASVPAPPPNARYKVKVMMTCNLIGITCARSLHYQFYSWYAQHLPLLLWHIDAPAPARILVLLAIEYAWNVFPSTAVSSAILLASHLALLAGLYFRDLDDRPPPRRASLKTS
ncbi:glycosyltransferase family 58 protein [Mixia osmundae IAM 14324]|uniref:Dol-P-Man:Man(5)GlcNAc(2)-PP-Dol alpha-1,3-mannosyltransferase n=1 Tax=Mixia osmundae (strain CBS 9802 / IAM 14324 / JCM 22182 / KY 12970) TaxID=764103 RepID=G7DY72_MIXOS|nr:glycosyltransferase family 58 protein [Mixia osmundae IAM 14324]KEI41435.1 glycosyltransferase family 58 protein [Mixia osmundae IAM 14324]GAA95532.1 hypothetical protein E5Q_02187 [Mixia osmundae IAM 14324]